MPPLSPVSVIPTWETPFFTGAGVLAAAASLEYTQEENARTVVKPAAVINGRSEWLVFGMSCSFVVWIIGITAARGVGIGGDGFGGAAQPDQNTGS